MAGRFDSWSKTAASNSNSDATINWAEGQAPSTVNGSARAEMAALASFRDDINGSLTTAGSSNAYTITTNIAFTALATGLMIAFKANHTNTGAATLAANGLTAKALRTQDDAALVAGQIVNNGQYYAKYDAAANAAAGAWLVQNPTIPAATTALSGVVELATNAETQTATDTSRAITPANHIAAHNPRFRASRAASQSLTADASTKIQVSTESLDSDGAYDPATNYRFTPLVAGDYLITGSANVTTDTGSSILSIHLNGATFASTRMSGDAGGETLGMSVTAIVPMNGSTDYVELFATSSLNAGAAVSEARFAGFRIGPSS